MVGPVGSIEQKTRARIIQYFQDQLNENHKISFVAQFSVFFSASIDQKSKPFIDHTMIKISTNKDIKALGLEIIDVQL